MKCKNKMLSKRSQTQNNPHCMIPLMLNSKTGKTILFMATHLASENHYKGKERTDYHKSLDSDSSGNKGVIGLVRPCRGLS